MRRIKALAGVALVIAAGYVAWKLAPPYFANMQFQDGLDSEARMSAYSITLNENDIRNHVLKQARQLDIPVRDQDIQVQRDNTQTKITVNYVVHVDLPIYPLDLKFHLESKGVRM